VIKEMSDAWGGHSYAVLAAIDRIGELQEGLALCTDRCELALGMTQNAIGDTQMESGTNAQAFLAGIQERINEAYGMAQQAVAELERYRGGF